jgi:hypothetical protein
VSAGDLPDSARIEPLRKGEPAIAMILLYALVLYALIGLVTAVAFVSFGLAAVLPHNMTASLGARILFIPGAAALWPYVLVRWRQARSAA